MTVRRQGTVTIAAGVAAFLASMLFQLLFTWIAMLALGAAFSHDSRIPPLGFLTTLWLGLALRFLITAADSSSRSSS